MSRVLLHPDSFGAGPQPTIRPGGLPPLGTKAPQVIPGGVPGPRPVANGPAPTAVGAEGLPPEEAPPKIRSFGDKLAGPGVKHEDNWNRSPNATGTGAIHVKSFHCKLTGDSLENMDRQINEWLDAHPQYEVKMATSTVGDWTGKLKEANLIVQVWV